MICKITKIQGCKPKCLQFQALFWVCKITKLQGCKPSTLNDIVNDKTKLYTCKGITLYKIAKALNIPMENLVENSEYTREIDIKYEEVIMKCTIYSFKQQHVKMTYKKEVKNVDLNYNLTHKAEREYFNTFLEMLADSFMKEIISKQNM